MAIVKTAVTIGNKQYDYTYSDRGMMIHGGVPEADYAEVYDPYGSNRTYTETDIPVDGESTAEEIINILTGVSE